MPKLQKMPSEYFSPESDAHMLMQAHRIRSDPKRHAAAKKHASDKLAAMRAIAEEGEATPDAESPAEDMAEIKAMKGKRR